jgi:hypothetical protein
MVTTKIAAAALFAGAAAATVVGFAGAAHAAPTASHFGMYGDPAAAAPYWQMGHHEDCALLSVSYVVGQITGHEPSESEILAVAENTPSTVRPGPIFQTSRPGTFGEDIRVVLAHYGIHATNSSSNGTAHTQDSPSNFQLLELHLAEGRKVLVNINAQTIWDKADVVATGAEPSDHRTPHHNVEVIGIDTRAGVVHLNDSGNGHGRDEQVSIAKFEAAWATSHDYATTTS